MNIFIRKDKASPNEYYFGDYNDNPLAPFSVSIASIDDNFAGEKPHYHKINQKVYITLSGKGILNVNGKQVELQEKQMINVEPGEIHFIEKIVEAPLKIVVVNSSKIDDRIILN